MKAYLAGLAPLLTLLAGACGGTTIGTAGDSDGDGGTEADASSTETGSATFACGTATCDVGAQYCLESGGGVPLPDAGSNFSATCETLPAACTASPSCACVEAATSNTCPCTTNGGGVTIECLYP
jgi:hypothetical protein